MPFGGNDWLALTPEPALEPELPICDPHHHFWDFRTARIPYQRYLLHMYNAFKRVSKGYSAAERAAMFHDTAARVYRIAA